MDSGMSYPLRNVNKHAVGIAASQKPSSSSYSPQQGMEAELRKYEVKWIVHSSQLCTYDHCLLALLSDRNTCLDLVVFFTLSGNYVAPYITALQQGDHCVVLLEPLQTFRKRHSIGFSPSRA